MQQLLPNHQIIPRLTSTCTFFYFFKLKGSGNIGALIRQKFAKQQAKCLYWLDCKYAFIGEGENTWTHAAIFKFSNFEAVKQAIASGISCGGVEAIQGFAVHTNPPPKFIPFLFKLLRPIGTFLNRNAKKWTVNEVLAIMGSAGVGGITPTEKQISRHLQNKDTSKAYMINLLQTYKNAKYDGEDSKVSGATAYYRRYGFVAARSVYMLGGGLVLSGRMGQPIIEFNTSKLTKGAWEGIGIMQYPNPTNLIDLEKMPGYKKSLVHRNAGLERTVLIVAKNGLSTKK